MYRSGKEIRSNIIWTLMCVMMTIVSLVFVPFISMLFAAADVVSTFIAWIFVTVLALGYILIAVVIWSVWAD